MTGAPIQLKKSSLCISSFFKSARFSVRRLLRVQRRHRRAVDQYVYAVHARHNAHQRPRQHAQVHAQRQFLFLKRLRQFAGKADFNRLFASLRHPNDFRHFRNIAHRFGHMLLYQFVCGNASQRFKHRIQAVDRRRARVVGQRANDGRSIFPSAEGKNSVVSRV